MRKPNFTLRSECEVTKILLEKSGRRASGVSFVDTSGEEWEQRAELVILCAFQLFNVQLLMLSGIGRIYDPNTGDGQIGRNFSHQTISTAAGFFDKDKFNFNPFIASGAIGMCIDEFNGDNFDHGPHGFVGGGYMGQVQSNGRPIEAIDALPPGTPAWGIKWKQAVRDNYLSTVYAGTGVHGSCHSYRSNHLDLDPTYKDRFGRPLVRMTMDFPENELKMSAFLTDRYAEIIKAMGAREVRQEAPHRAIRRHSVPDLASVRRRDHRRQPEGERAQQVSAELGRAEPVRRGCYGLSAERRATTRPARSARWRSGRPRRSARGI